MFCEENEKIFLGLDIGTNSVGWAVTDDRYNLKKFHSELMWGVHLFDEAQQSAKRRGFRTARRRTERRKQRIALLQEFFAKEILKKDEKFFLRLKESALLPEDSEHRTHNIFFDDEGFTDKEYFDKYPTIHHLICELMDSKEAHDVRLVYLACAYILAHRGHFLYSVDKDNAEKITDFSPLHESFLNAVENICEELPFDSDPDRMSEILSSEISAEAKKKQLTELWFGGKKPKNDLCDDLRFDLLIKLLSGGPVKLSELFMNESYKELNKDSVSVSAADFEDTLDALYGTIEDDQWELLDCVKKLCDQSLLVRSLGECSCISEAKVAVYNKHQKDLCDLKYICKKYLSKQQYNEIFKDKNTANNYTAYVYNGVLKKCEKQEDFCKFVQKYIKKIQPESADKLLADELIEKCKSHSLCPKQVTTDNRVIPYQLYYVELKKILKNASAYLDFLNDKDEYGTVADKILSIMEFRIPYYVGPLVSKDKSEFAWLVRKAEGKIYPWNYKDKIDLDSTEDEFIKRMTCKCTYLADEDVLPKNSLLYCKFSVLNEINNITVDGNKISVNAKQTIYNELFMKKQSVTVKAIANCLKSCGEFKDGQSLGGIDVTVKSSLKSYHDFKRLLTSGIINEDDAEKIIERITATTDTGRLKKWLKEQYPQISDADVKYISALKYKDYGRLSKKLLEEIFEIDTDTGELYSDRNIITALWETNDNLMQILGSKYKFGSSVEKFNADYYSDPKNRKTIPERMKDMYIPTAVRRSVTRTLDIVKEIKSIIGKDPDKIFIEMARGSDDDSKGKRTSSRREQIKALLAAASEIADKKRLDELNEQLESIDDGRLRSEKYFLYFTQLGRCMYTGHTIDFDRLGSDTFYNVDHIWPQARVKDDSLDNKALVESEANGTKGDTYPISADIRHKMHSFWKGLKEKELISEKKYQRLTRNTNFTDEELAGFIARQLVETSQSTKAVAEILKELCPDSRIVYVKARLASEFRQEMNMLKCREVNDLHHAKDAYLNIVMGNVYNTKFTDDPLNFVKRTKNYSLKMFKRSQDGEESGLLNHMVKRNGNVAWDPSVSFEIVRKMMSKNSIRYVRYCYRRKGELFKVQPLRKSEGLVERKKGLDSTKYGGYGSTAASYFTVVKYGKAITFVPVDIMYEKKYSSDKEYARNYIAKQLYEITKKDVDAEKIEFPLGDRAVKINTLLEIDGFRVNITKKTNDRLGIISASSLILDKKHYDYAKTVTSFVAKHQKDKSRRAEDIAEISSEKNIELFDVFVSKMMSAPFNVKLGDTGAKVMKGRDKFEKLDLTEQAVALANILSLLKTGRSDSCDIRAIGGCKDAGKMTINSTITKMRNVGSMYIIDQSPTGLYEKRSPDLMKL